MPLQSVMNTLKSITDCIFISCLTKVTYLSFGKCTLRYISWYALTGLEREYLRMEMTSLSKEVEEVTADDDKEHVETGKKSSLSWKGAALNFDSILLSMLLPPASHDSSLSRRGHWLHEDRQQVIEKVANSSCNSLNAFTSEDISGKTCDHNTDVTSIDCPKLIVILTDLLFNLGIMTDTWSLGL